MPASEYSADETRVARDMRAGYFVYAPKTVLALRLGARLRDGAFLADTTCPNPRPAHKTGPETLLVAAAVGKMQLQAGTGVRDGG